MMPPWWQSEFMWGIYQLLMFVLYFTIGYQWHRGRRYQELRNIHVGKVIRIDGKYFKLQSYEHASGGVMDCSTVYTFIDLTLEEMDQRKIRRPKGWRKGKNGRLY